MKSGLFIKSGAIPLAAIVIMVFATAALGQGTDTSQVSPKGPAVAMLPMANYSGDAEATENVIPVIIRVLGSSVAGLIGPGDLRPVLRAHRIRAVGMIGRDGAEALASDLDVTYLLLGSLDFYRGGDNPALGFSLHLLHVPDMTPFWAVSMSAVGNEYTGLFELGGISDVDSLVTRLSGDAAAHIRKAIKGYSPGRADASSPLVAIVRFDDIDSDQPIGAVASTYLLTRLVHDGIRVVEPGVTRETFLDMNRAPRGEIDHGLIDVLRDSLNVDLIITGAVDEFSVTGTGGGGTKAEVSLGARLIDAASHRIESAQYVIKQSETGSGLLSRGSDYPPADVVMEAIKDVVGKLSVSSPRAETDTR
jgi:hypothetical protein